MKSISFKNFRRFADFPEFKFGDITILVGGNNAGKSTLVKALLLILDNLKTMRREINPDENVNIFQVLDSPEFRFDENTYHELNIKNFSRALNRHSKDERMTFTLEVEHPVSKDIFRFEIVVSKYRVRGENHDSKEDARGLIDFIRVCNLTKEIHFDFSFTTWAGEAYMYVHIADEAARELAARIDSLKRQKKELSRYIKKHEPDLTRVLVANFDDMDKLAEAKAELAKIDKVLKDITSDKNKAKDVEVKIPLSFTIDQTSKYLLLDLINDVIAYSDYSSFEKKGAKAYNREMQKKDLLKAHQSTIAEFAGDIRYLLDSFGVDYIQAHGVTQKTLFSTADDSDHIARTVKGFMQSRAWRNEKIREFIRFWMDEFKIGYDFKIADIDGEAFKVFILETPEDKKGFPLADLGMGSIQLMMLLFALATSIKHNIGSVFGNPTVIIEEPEQNLHPAVQSKLADLLFQIKHEFGLKFIVETHSEYLIRRSQVLMADPSLALWFQDEVENVKDMVKDMEHPFKVYYFPENGIPYDMVYRPDGRFSEEFGAGFFDEASNLAISLF